MSHKVAIRVEDHVGELAPRRRFRAYPEYRDSSVDWLGCLPEPWKTVRLKRLFRIVNGSTPKSSEASFWDGDIHWVTPDDLGSLSTVEIRDTARQITREGYESCGTTLVPPGSIVVSTRAPIGHLALAAVPLCINQGCRCLVPYLRIDSRYFYYELLAARGQLESRGQGSTFRELGRSELASVSLACPTLPEQQSIAAFLDRETARIDELIAKKQRLIELLAEKRTALISHAVTGETVVSKDATWREMQLGRAIKLQRGFDITGASDADGLVPVISSGGFSGFCDVPIVAGPGVIVGRKGTLGTVHYVATNYWPHDTTLWVKQFRGNHPRFVYYFLIHMKLERFDVGAANPTVNRNHVHLVTVLWPDKLTQQNVAAFLDEQIQHISSLSSLIEQAVARLREYRAALISAAITGKIDVREEV